MRQIQVYCKNTDRDYQISEFSSASEFIQQQDIKLDLNPIAILVDNVARDLDYKIHHTCSIEYIDETHPEGHRIYFNSLSFILYKAVYELYPSKLLKIEHAIANGYYCQIESLGEDIESASVQIKARMQAIVAENLKFEYEIHRMEAMVELYKEQGLAQKSKLLKRKNSLYTKTYKLGQVYNFFYGAMAESTSRIKDFDVQPYYQGLLLTVPNDKIPHLPNSLASQKKVFNVLNEYRNWSEVLGISDVDDINYQAVNDRGSELIKLSEALHEKRISEIATAISQDEAKKVVLIAGPSSSGKTSFSKRLSIQLRVNKKNAVAISMDDYFMDRDKTPRDENGDFDFENIGAVDIPQFNSDIDRLIQGEEVDVPRFNFHTGYREAEGVKTLIGENEILIIEGIHALNPSLLAETPKQKIAKIYVSALATTSLDHHNRIATSDIRLIRRLVRDTNYRNMDTHRVFELWGKVLAGERVNIFPYQDNADFIFNSALPYELSMMKHYALPRLQRLSSKSEYNYLADRLRNLFSFVKSIPSEEIPPTSLLREFIGGSSFNY